MYKKTITYIDFDDNEVTETLYFHMTEAELMEMELANNGIQKRYENAMENNNAYELSQLMKDLILRSYGEKSQDGRRFVKTQEMQDAFKASEAYSKFYTELMQSEDMASEFVRKILPSNLKETAENALREREAKKKIEAPKAENSGIEMN